MRCTSALLLVALACVPARAGSGDAARAEIEALIAALGASDCQFQRNGRWYDGARAARHLQRKYGVYLQRTPMPHAEEFIEAVASRSSFSGRAYRVRCDARPETDSATWFGQQLQRLREDAPD